VYGRAIDGKVLSFGHEGVLYRNSFVMYDKTTDSKWLHVTGEALKGSMKGKKLGFVPSVILPWKTWKLRHPRTTVLLGKKVGGLMGSYNLSKRIEAFGLSVGEGRDVSLFRYELLAQAPVLDAYLGDQAIVVTYAPEAAYGVAFSSVLGERILHFDAFQATGDPRLLMRDAETGSLWARMTGECLAGPLVGQQLIPIPATAWLGNRWLGFFPDGKVVGSEKL
jgi:hypothetical protein